MRTATLSRIVAICLLAPAILWMPKAQAQTIPALEAFPDDIQARLEQRERERRTLPPRIGGEAFDFVISRLGVWTPGRPITVAFNGGDVSLQKLVADTAAEWSRHGNILFDFGYDPAGDTYRRWSPTDRSYAADIRIAFDTRGYWSLVGTDSVDPSIVAPGQPSMSLSGFAVALPDDWATTVLHEFGHALGFQHEHQHPVGGCNAEFRWEDSPDGTPGVYSVLGGRPNYWPKWKVDHNLRQLVNSDAYRSSPHDRLSIMHYAFEAWMFVRGDQSHCYTPRNTAISVLDALGASQLYPTDDRDLRRLMGERSEALRKLLEIDGLGTEQRNQLKLQSERQ